MVVQKSSNSHEAERYYNKLASIYDQATENKWSAPAHVSGLTMKLATPDKNILDIGIGTGQSIAEIHASGKFKTIEAIDVSQTMLDQCAAKYPDILLHHGDFINFAGFKRQDYDLIICCGMLEFVDDLERFIARCRDCLVRDGDIVLTFEPVIDKHVIQSQEISPVQAGATSDHAHFMTYRHAPETLVEILRKYDLDIISRTDFVAYQKGDTAITYSLAHIRLKQP